MEIRQRRIRKAQESDVEDILNVLGYYNFKIIGAVDNSPIDADAADTITVYNQVSEMDLQNAFVAVDDGKIVGFSHYKHVEEGVAKTTLITVLPKYRNLGLGKDLQLARMKEAYDRGYRKLITYCESPNVVSWYMKHFDYKIVRSEPGHHRLHFLKVKNRIIWGVHYGFREFKNFKVLVCDLNRFFKSKIGEKNGKRH